MRNTEKKTVPQTGIGSLLDSTAKFLERKKAKEQASNYRQMRIQQRKEGAEQLRRRHILEEKV